MTEGIQLQFECPLLSLFLFIIFNSVLFTVISVDFFQKKCGNLSQSLGKLERPVFFFYIGQSLVLF